MSADWTVVGDRLRRLREGRRWTQGQVAERLKDLGVVLHPSAVSKVEAGDRALRLDEGAALIRLFHVDLDELIPLSRGIDEPTGLGAVVEDARGGRYVLLHPGERCPWAVVGIGSNQRWQDIDAVRVLSPGWSE